jgi:hypothetical protein
MSPLYQASGSLLTPNGLVAARVLPILRTPWGTAYRMRVSGLGTFPLAGSGARNSVRRPRRRGLGAGDPTAQGAVQIGGTVASVGTSIGASAGLIAASAVPIVGAAVALIGLIASFIGGGCGNACVDSSEAEQIYEYAAQCLDAAAKAGMIDQNQLQTGLQNLLSGGQQHMQALEATDSSAKNGYANLTKALNSDLAYAATVPTVAPNALDLSTVQSLFPGTTGWYAGSAQAGAQLAMAYLEALPASPTAGASGTVSILGSTFSITDLLFLAGAAALAYAVL